MIFSASRQWRKSFYERLRAAERFATMQREMIRLATTDSLIGTFNRRAFFDKAKDLCTRADVGESLSAIMVDIDHFKHINDVHGHDVAMMRLAKWPTS